MIVIFWLRTPTSPLDQKVTHRAKTFDGSFASEKHRSFLSHLTPSPDDGITCCRAQENVKDDCQLTRQTHTRDNAALLSCDQKDEIVIC